MLAILYTEGHAYTRVEHVHHADSHAPFMLFMPFMRPLWGYIPTCKETQSGAQSGAVSANAVLCFALFAGLPTALRAYQNQPQSGPEL